MAEARALQPCVIVSAGIDDSDMNFVQSFLNNLAEGRSDPANTRRFFEIIGKLDRGQQAVVVKQATEKCPRLDDRRTVANHLIQNEVALIAAFTTPAGQAAKAATRTTPIVFTTISDPVRTGLVSTHRALK
jgi:hypothetical protein